jgi:hypothetical protein
VFQERSPLFGSVAFDRDFPPCALLPEEGCMAAQLPVIFIEDFPTSPTSVSF